jgi:DNA adenine methylase
LQYYYSPLRYPGGKNCIFKFVAGLFDENNLHGASYAEPYAGGAGLALRLLFEEYVGKIYINDLDYAIYAFWETVTQRADDFCAWVEEVPVSMDSWYFYRDLQKNCARDDIFELAKSTFFLNRTNVSGVIKGGVIGGMEQKGKYKIDARFKKADLIARIQKIARFKTRIQVSNCDGLDFIKKLDEKKEEIFIYLDPPYYQKGADLYMNFYSDEEHRNLSEYVHKLRKKWMVSYDNHDFILNLYGSRKRFTHKLAQNTSNRVGDEVFIFSDEVLFANSMKNLRFPELVV